MPLEQLLAHYGYAPPTSLEEIRTQSEAKTQAATQSHSNSSIRLRRRNKVVPLEPQKAVTPDSGETKLPIVPPSSSCKEELPGNGADPGMGIESVHDGKSHSGTNFNNVLPPADAVDMSPEENIMNISEGVEQEKRAWQTDTDSDEVDVVEIDESGLGLVRDEGILRLDEMERAGLDVVRMDDIEAGLSRNEEALMLGGGAGRAAVEGVLSGSEGVGLEEVSEGEVDDLEDRASAVYEDVLLSSGNTGLLSDSTGMTLYN